MELGSGFFKKGIELPVYFRQRIKHPGGSRKALFCFQNNLQFKLSHSGLLLCNYQALNYVEIQNFLNINNTWI